MALASLVCIVSPQFRNPQNCVKLVKLNPWAVSTAPAYPDWMVS